MRPLILLALLTCSSVFAKVVVFWQDGFPTVASQPISRDALSRALDGTESQFAGLDTLQSSMRGADLLVLPYGSAFPAEAWTAIRQYVRDGGNLLVIGGQPFHVPVTSRSGKFTAERPQDRFARDLDFRHTYEIPRQDATTFAWKHGYSFLGAQSVRARRFFAVEGSLNGLGYIVDADGVNVAAPVIVADRRNPATPGIASRIVMLDFEPVPDYWESADGITLVRAAARYARQGAAAFSVEALFSTIKAGEIPELTIHLDNIHRGQVADLSQRVKLELLSGTTVVETTDVAVTSAPFNSEVSFHKSLPPGFYTVRATYEKGGEPREAYTNGFWVDDQNLLTSGPALSVSGDFITRDGRPFFPVGTNYFTTEDYEWDFSAPRNAWVWERDFTEMSSHGVNFVRTGIWMPYLRMVEPTTGQVNERFLRNLEAFLLSARRHNIAVNFTLFAFFPRAAMPTWGPPTGEPPNPYLDPAMLHGEEEYIRSIVNRFKDAGWLSWDLINEPSFSNPRRPWKGNTPNGDPVELAAWRKWLAKKYGNVTDLAAAWSVSPDDIGSFDKVPLPSQEDLAFTRYGNQKLVRAVDYNLFAQDMFSEWVHRMVTTIRSTGSQQLIDVGQDEGGVNDRVLNQFYATAGVSFTTNHTYWHDDALLWDSVVSKRQGIPSIVGETGYQPVWSADGTWRYDEITGSPLLERKWALGFAAGTSGALQWDWARESDFGMKRSDGSAKSWEFMMRDMGQFAAKASPYATGIVQPEIAIVLPQSLQLSTSNATALQAQQRCVRALYQDARAEAYVAGEYQIEQLRNPKLILLPSPFGLTDSAWEAILGKVRAGATLLVTGVFDGDAHMHPTGRQNEVGLPYDRRPLTLRDAMLKWPGGEARLIYDGDATTFLDRAALPDQSNWAERAVGKGRILFSALPLELNRNEQAIGDVYRYALKVSGVSPTYTTPVQDPGILICPTQFPNATLYVLTSETTAQQVMFRDGASGKDFSTQLGAGRAALVLIGHDGTILASYNWHAS